MIHPCLLFPPPPGADSPVDQGTLGLVYRVYLLPPWLRDLLAPVVGVWSPLLARLVGHRGLPTRSDQLWAIHDRRHRLADQVRSTYGSSIGYGLPPPVSVATPGSIATNPPNKKKGRQLYCFIP